MKIAEKVIDIMVFAIAVFIILLSVLPLFHLKSFVVVSGSMEPEIPTGSVCVVDADRIHPETGEVAAYEKGGITVVHRIIGMTEDGRYITKGDSNDSPDPGYVKPNQIKGTTVLDIPHLGYIVSFFKEPAGIAAAAVMTALYLFLRHVIINKNIARKEVKT